MEYGLELVVWIVGFLFEGIGGEDHDVEGVVVFAWFFFFLKR